MVEIMTDKATVEIPAPRAGKVLKRMYAEGQTCPVGKVLIAIEEAAGAQVEARAEQPALPPPASSVSASPPSASPLHAMDGSRERPISSQPVTTTTVPLATPATRKLARDLGIDLTTISGTGPAGRITSDDVQAAKSAPTN